METKPCTRCKKVKLLSEFGIDSRLKSGIRADCKECNRLLALKYRNENLEKARASSRNWAKKNPKKATENKLRWAKENREKVLQQGKEYHARNRGNRLAAQKAVRAANPEKYRELTKVWRKENMGYVLAKNAERRAAKMQRTPAWLTEIDLKNIKALYIKARQKTESTGEPWHVDHIIPLQGELVSGLHVPSNLRVIPGIENLKKRHKYEIE